MSDLSRLETVAVAGAVEYSDVKSALRSYYIYTATSDEWISKE